MIVQKLSDLSTLTLTAVDFTGTVPKSSSESESSIFFLLDILALAVAAFFGRQSSSEDTLIFLLTGNLEVFGAFVFLERASKMEGCFSSRNIIIFCYRPILSLLLLSVNTLWQCCHEI